ncbi:MAG: competence protein CoiA family protein [Bacteroidota bacterium]
MQYALVDGIRTKPAKGLKGICTGCKKDVTAKCGSVKIHHWAHNSLRDCDTWWEPETEWHLNWKNQFPEEYREVVFFAENGDLHRADIHTPKGVTIEFQNSPISFEELTSRVNFYDKLIWIINAQSFRNQIDAFPIPDPEHPLLAQYEICGYSRHSKSYNYPTNSNEAINFMNSLMLRRIAEYPQDPEEGRVRSFGEKLFIKARHKATKNPLLYETFDWRYKRKAWLNCSAPVFFDFGDDCLRWLKYRKNPQDQKPYFKLVSKANFIKHYI